MKFEVKNTQKTEKVTLETSLDLNTSLPAHGLAGCGFYRDTLPQTLLDPNITASQHFCIQTLLYPKIPVSQHSYIPKFLYPNIPVSRYSCIPTLLCPNIPASKHFCIPEFLYPNIPAYKLPCISALLHPNIPVSQIPVYRNFIHLIHCCNQPLQKIIHKNPSPSTLQNSLLSFFFDSSLLE